MNWLKSFLNEPHTQEGSSQRLCLVLLVVTILALVSLLTITTGKLPEVPGSLETLIEYLGTALVAGIFGGKGLTAWKGRGLAPQVPVPLEPTAVVAGPAGPMGPRGETGPMGPAAEVQP